MDSCPKHVLGTVNNPNQIARCVRPFGHEGACTADIDRVEEADKVCKRCRSPKGTHKKDCIYA